MLDQNDIKNILALIGKATIVGSDALTVAVLLDKLNKMLLPEETKEEKK